MSVKKRDGRSFGARRPKSRFDDGNPDFSIEATAKGETATRIGFHLLTPSEKFAEFQWARTDESDIGSRRVVFRLADRRFFSQFKLSKWVPTDSPPCKRFIRYYEIQLFGYQ